MKTLFKNARILTMMENEPIFSGELVVEDTEITFVGKKAPSLSYDKIINCHGNLLMPGFKNAHAHSAMTFLRSSADDLPLHTWLFDRVFPLEAKLTSEDEYHLSKVAILEYLSSGITACMDMYFSSLSMRKASDEMGFRTALLGTVTKDTASVGEMEKLYHEINDHPDGLTTYMMGYHAEYTVREEVLKEFADAVHRLKCPVFTHNSETASEVEECKQRHNGMTPTEYADSLGLFDYGGGSFHCVYFSDHDMEIFKKKGLTVVSCPGSNAKLASGIAPLTEYNEKGISLALGTDGPASNNALDFFYEMRLACVLQKLKENKAEAFDASLALKAATVGGAKAMGLNNCLYLKEGQKADMIMINLMRPSMQPLNQMDKNLVYSGSKDCIKMTMINGVIRYYNGRFYVGESIKKIYQKAQQITDRLQK